MVHVRQGYVTRLGSVDVSPASPKVSKSPEISGMRSPSWPQNSPERSAQTNEEQMPNKCQSIQRLSKEQNHQNKRNEHNLPPFSPVPQLLSLSSPTKSPKSRSAAICCSDTLCSPSRALRRTLSHFARTLPLRQDDVCEGK